MRLVILLLLLPTCLLVGQGLSSGLSVTYGAMEYGNYSPREVSIGYTHAINKWLGAHVVVATSPKDVQSYSVPVEIGPDFEYELSYATISAKIGLNAYLFGFANQKFQTHLRVDGGIMRESISSNKGLKVSRYNNFRGGISLEEQINLSSKMNLVVGYQRDFISGDTDNFYTGPYAGLKFKL